MALNGVYRHHTHQLCHRHVVLKELLFDIMRNSILAYAFVFAAEDGDIDLNAVEFDPHLRNEEVYTGLNPV